MVEELWADEGDAGEEVVLRGVPGDAVADVGDALGVGIERDLARFGVGAQHESDEVVVLLVRLDGSLQGEIREDVPIVNPEGGG